MSTIKVTNVSHPSAASPAIVLDAAGDATYAGVHDFTAATVTGITAGKVLQVVTATYSVQTTTTSTGIVSTGLTATITPSTATNKVLAMVSGAGAVYTNNARGYWQIYRGTTGGVGVGSAAWILNSTGSMRSALSCIALDSPSTTSAQIYTFIFSSTDGGSLTTQFNNVNSTMILMEIEA